MSTLKKRIEYLKNCKKLANSFLEIYKKKQNESGYKSWEKEVIFFNVKKLKEIISEINRLLTQKSLDEYVSADEATNRIANGEKKSSDFYDYILSKSMKGFRLPFKIVKYSPSYSILFDLNWIKDGTVKEHMDIALGNLPIAVISSKYFDYRMERVSEYVQSYISSHNKYSICHQVLESAVGLSKVENYLASNILILTGIESLVRLLIEFILPFQFPDLTESEIEIIAFKRYNSLESLIRKCEFTEDYPITLPEAILLRDFGDDHSLDKYKIIYDNHVKEATKFREFISKFMEKTEFLKLDESKSEELFSYLQDQKKEFDEIDRGAIIENMQTEKYPISIRIKLFFLVRRLKDLRNEVVHGKFDIFSTKHYNYISLAALHEVIELIKDYDNIYNERNTTNNKV